MKRYTARKRIHEAPPAIVHNGKGGVENFLHVFKQTTDYERQQGLSYYDRQRAQIGQYAEGFAIDNAIGAFCALSPNNSEKTTYRDLLVCCKIVKGVLPETATTGAYPINKQKALRMLRGESPKDVLAGRKVTAFYQNTIDPTNEDYITIDGHVYSVWAGVRFKMYQVRYLGKRLYAEISNDLIEAAHIAELVGPKFQSTIWLAWKRIYAILHKPQLKLEFDE